MTRYGKSLIYQLAPLEGKCIGLTHPQPFVALVVCGAILLRLGLRYANYEFPDLTS